MNEFKRMQQLAGIITESQLNEVKGIKIGMEVLDGMNDKYKIISSEPNQIILKPLTFKGENSIFPQDFEDADIQDFWMHFKKQTNESQLNEAEKYGGQSADRGATGSSIEFTIVDNTPEYYTIDYKITPNSRYSSKTASRYNVREPKEGRERIKKDPNAVQKEWIRVSGDDFLIGKSFAKEIYPEEN